MPIYEYECPGEGVTRELELPMNHERPRCEVCGAEMNRIYTANPVHFKGTGFYKTGG